LGRLPDKKPSPDAHFAPDLWAVRRGLIRHRPETEINASLADRVRIVVDNRDARPPPVEPGRILVAEQRQSRRDLHISIREHLQNAERCFVIGAKKGGNVGSPREKRLAARNSRFDAIDSAKYQTGPGPEAEFPQSAIVTRQTLTTGGGFFEAHDDTDAPMA
jgi:hypothetical protein